MIKGADCKLNSAPVTIPQKKQTLLLGTHLLTVNKVRAVMENDANIQLIEVGPEKSVQVIHCVAERGEVEVWEEIGGTYTIVTPTASKPFLCQIARKLDRGEIVTLLTKTIDGYEDIVSTPSHNAADCLSTSSRGTLLNPERRRQANLACGGFRRRWRAEQLRSVTWPSSWISGLTQDVH